MHVPMQQIPHKLGVTFSDEYGWSNVLHSLGLRNSAYKYS